MWRNLSNEERERLYSCRMWTKRAMSPDEVIHDYVKTLSEGSAAVRQHTQFESIQTGLSPEQTIDFFHPAERDAPIFMFFHGGYWCEGSRDLFHVLAPTFLEAGAGLILAGYSLAPKVKVGEIVEQARRSVAYVLNIAKRRESRGVYLCGHSAGAQLVSLVLATNWMSEHMLSPGLIKGAFLLSGVFDLRPLVGTSVSDDIGGIDESEAWKLSPQRHIAQIAGNSCKIIVAVAECESPEYKRQSDEFYQELKSKGCKNCEFFLADGEDHFTIVLKLNQPDFPVTKKIFEVMSCIPQLLSELDCSKD